jgi:hypothetical protein
MSISRFSKQTILNGFPKLTTFWDQTSTIFNELDPFNDSSQVMYYKLDNANASSGGLNLTTEGTVTYSTGIKGNAAYFNGGNNGLSTSTTFLSGTGARSFSAWVWTNTGATGRQLAVGQGDFGTEQKNFDLEVNGYHAGSVSDSYGIHYWGNGLKFDSAAVLYNQWVHLVLVHDGGGTISSSNTRLYLNGVSKTLNNASPSPSPSFSISSTSNFRIGSRLSGGSYDLQSTGRIDQVRVFNKALTSTEANILYAGGQ